SATEDISALAAGTYSLLVTDQNGCTAQSSIVLSQPDPLSSSVILSQFANGDAISCAGAADGSIKLIVEGGAAPYSVQWSGPNGFTASGLIISGLGEGSYHATVTDANGCTYTSTVAINAPDPLGFTSALSAYIGGTEVSCHDAHDGSIALMVTGGAGNTIFQWSGDQAFTSNSEDVSGLPAGTYTVVVTDLNGCSVTDDFVLNAPQPIQASAAITTAACQGASNGAIDLTTTGGTGPYGFFWSGPGAYSSAAEDITDLFAGVHTVTITDVNGCSLESSFDVNQPGLFTISASVGVYPGGFNTSCALANDGYIDATVSGGTTPYYYFWNGPNGYTSITEDISGLSAGTYALTLTDQNGCSALAQYTIVSATALAASASATVYNGGVNTTCHEVPDGAIDAVITGGVPPYNTQWTGPDGYVSIAEDLSALAAGSYHLIVTDAVGCQTSLDIELTAPTALEATATISSYGGGYGVSCASANDGSIDLTIIGGTAPYNTTWTGPNGFSNGNTDISALTAGSYMASITDANGCTTSISVNLTAPSPIALSLQPSLFSGGFNIPCAGSDIGTINASASGGNGTLTFLWTGPNGFSSSLEDIEDLEAGSYTLTTTDENGCTNAATIELIGPAPVAVSTSLSDAGNGYQVSCLTNDGTISFTTTGGTQPIQYAWTGPNGFAAQDEDITNLSAGDYFLLVSDANGCVLNDTITLTAPAPLTVDPVVSDAICHGSTEGSIQMNASGGTMPYTYVWSGPNGFTSTDEDIAGSVAGDYSVTISDAGTCSGTWTASITSTSALLADVYRSQYGSVNIPCAGDSTGVIEVAIAGGVEPVSIQWVGPSGFTSTEHNISGLIAGEYTFTITDGNNCVLDSTITLVQPALALQASLLADLAPNGDHIACFGGATGSIAATVIGGTAPYIYDWRGPDSVAFNTADISGLIAGGYELVVTDSNHCAIATSITLTEADSTSLTVTISEHAGGANTSCAGVNDGNIAVTISGGSPAFDLTWTGPNGFTANGDSISMLNAGDYLLTATDMNGCITDSLITIVAPDPLTWDQQISTYAGGTNIRCADGADGSIQMTLAGGSGNYDILWTGPGGYSATTTGLDGLAAGEYCFQFTDENGCSASDCITLTQPEVLQASAQTTSASCGQSNGNIDGAASGGTAPYSYAWSNGILLEDLTSVGPDTYTLTVTDANGCVASSMVELTGAPALLAAVAISDVLCHGDQTGSIDLTPMTGTAPFNFSWTGGAQTEDLDALAAGSYQVQMTDAAGCSWSTICTVAEPTELQADSAVLVHANGFEVSALGASDGSIAVEASGGTAPYAYLWSNGATGSSVEGLGEGEWNVTITDANGCTRTLSFNLDAPNDVELPTGFTPNGDGQNDRFIVRGIENYPENELIVFNRWGNV
ncbi:MAG: gliding motility-associated C-terminal domain-containing protein, partial [Flavobacteriales bacterium]|nr:gliding motility-associated C-terminal domain-containing protein [Flavobacteriales bacterium]